MSVEAVLALLGVVVIGTVDGLLVARVLRAWRKTHKRPHLVIAAGIVASFVAVVGVALVLAARGAPALATGVPWLVARSCAFVGAGLAFGLVALFAASAFGRSGLERGLAASILVALVSLGAVGVTTYDASIATPATTGWTFRLVFVGLALFGSIGGAVRATRLTNVYGVAARAGRTVDRVALGRMETMARGFVAMAIGEAPLLGFEPAGRFDTPLGLVCVATILLGAFGFVLACVATWATPGWLRARWQAEGR